MPAAWELAKFIETPGIDAREKGDEEDIDLLSIPAERYDIAGRSTCRQIFRRHGWRSRRRSAEALLVRRHMTARASTASRHSDSRHGGNPYRA